MIHPKVCDIMGFNVTIHATCNMKDDLFRAKVLTAKVVQLILTTALLHHNISVVRHCSILIPDKNLRVRMHPTRGHQGAPAGCSTASLLT